MAGKASPEAMERMVQNITKCIDAQQKVITSLKNDYAIVGEEWNDKQYTALGGVVDQAIRDFSATYASLSECTTKIQLLKRMLQDYLATQI